MEDHDAYSQNENEIAPASPLETASKMAKDAYHQLAEKIKSLNLPEKVRAYAPAIMAGVITLGFAVLMVASIEKGASILQIDGNLIDKARAVYSVILAVDPSESVEMAKARGGMLMPIAPTALFAGLTVISSIAIAKDRHASQ